MNEESIVEQYNSLNNINDIAKRHNTTFYRIKKILKNHNIKIRNQKEASKISNKKNVLLLENEQKIIKLYLDNNSMSKISKSFNVSRTVIRRILKSNNIKIRSASETSTIQFANHIEGSESLLNRINGWLLGDGGIEGNGQACFKIPSKHKEYIDYIEKFFNIENIKCNKYTTFDCNTKKNYYRLSTCSTIQFKKLKNLWYPNNKKIVPQNLKLTNECIKNWIMDDGTRNKKDGSLVFCTHGFNYNDCLLLARKINNFLKKDVAKVNKDGKYFKIRIGRVGANILFNKIGDCEVDCFNYKWFMK